VVELGTRTGVSTAALLAGVEARGGTVTSVDTDPASAQVAAGHPQWRFVNGSSTDLTTRAKVAPPVDVLLVDTLHTLPHVAAELEVWAPMMRPGGTICVHDTETFPGVRVAVETFCAAKGWPVTFVTPCNGMAVVEVRG
jgi:predicted O-methyltransferase YrrM